MKLTEFFNLQEGVRELPTVSARVLDLVGAHRIRDWAAAERFEPEISACFDRDGGREFLGDSFSIHQLGGTIIATNGLEAMFFDGDEWKRLKRDTLFEEGGIDVLQVWNARTGENYYVNVGAFGRDIKNIFYKLDLVE